MTLGVSFALHHLLFDGSLMHPAMLGSIITTSYCGQKSPTAVLLFGLTVQRVSVHGMSKG